jgi:hypothetical protein
MNDFACTHISELYWCCGRISPLRTPSRRGPGAATSIFKGSVCFAAVGQYFFENADAFVGRFCPEDCVAGFCYFGDASSSSLLMRLNLGLPRPPAASPPFFTYLGLVVLPLAAAAFKFRLLDRL